MNTKHICIVCDNYPTEKDPTFPFVAQLAEAIVKSGIDVTVIAPQNLLKYILGGNQKHPKLRTKNIGNNQLTILQPCCISFSNYTPKLNFISRRRAIERSFEHLKNKPDVCYGHFWHSGYFIYNMAKKYNLPLFVATGESVINFKVDNKTKKKFCEYVNGVICVSTKNKIESIEKGLATSEKCVVIPNAIDNSLFKKLDAKSCRSALGIQENDFVVAFVGWFSERKGSLRVSDAIEKLGNNNIKSIFIGSGASEYEPRCKNIIFKGRVAHGEIPKYLNAANVFVLPTLKEGCCNAVIEAMACGLPIISSDLDFNYDVLDSSNSIMINPLNVKEIAEAIKLLHINNIKRELLAEGAVKSSEELDIHTRAKRIVDFISK
ncbi:MAG: glycosyltransferase family 4 protein [Alistipes sp.]|nr:glycosyltransferase family 4 protein [Alistipes sp.]